MGIVNLDDGEVYRGNPENIVVGRIEKPARLHARQPARPAIPAEARIKLMILVRMQELTGAVEEYEELSRIDEILARV